MSATDSLPNDIESLRALALQAIAERDVAIAEREAAMKERDAERAAKAKLAAERDRLQSLYEHVHHLQGPDHRFGARNERLERLPADQLQLALEDLEASLAKTEATEEKQEPRLPHTRTRKRGEAMVASVLVAKYGWHLPLYRQAKMLSMQGIDIDRSTLAFWVGYAAAELAPLYERLKEHLLSSSRLAVDETPVPVLDPGDWQDHANDLLRFYMDTSQTRALHADADAGEPGEMLCELVRTVIAQIFIAFCCLTTAGGDAQLTPSRVMPGALAIDEAIPKKA